MKKRLAIILCVLICVSCAAPAFSADTTKPEPNANESLDATIESAISWYAENAISGWNDIVALEGVHVNFAQRGIALPELEPVDTASASELSARILTILALGKDAANCEGNDLPALLTALQKDDGAFGDYINNHIYAIIALDAAGAPDYDRDAALSFLLDAQLEDGGYAYFGETGDMDVTAMALMALACFPEDADAMAAVVDAVAFIKSVRTDNGGFVSSWSETGKENCNSAATVLSGLIAAGVDLTQDGWEKTVENLLSFQNEDGGFCAEPGGDSDVYATPQALQALGDLRMGNCVYFREHSADELVAMRYLDGADCADWAREAVVTAYKYDIMVGNDRGMFKPEQSIKRAELAQLMCNLPGAAAIPQITALTDVAEDAWYFDAVNAAIEAGFMSALDGLFRPEEPATRAETAFAMAKYLELSDSTSLDAVIAALVEAGIMAGDTADGSQFRAEDPLERQECALLFVKVLEMSKNG